MTGKIEELKSKIVKRLPELLPKVMKSVAVHIVMLIYHVSMPPWIMAIKIKKSLNSYYMNNKNKY